MAVAKMPEIESRSI